MLTPHPLMLMKVAISVVPNLAKATGAMGVAKQNTPKISSSSPAIRPVGSSLGESTQKLLGQIHSALKVTSSKEKFPAQTTVLRDLMSQVKRDRPGF